MLATVPRKARNKCRRLPEVQLAVRRLSLMSMVYLRLCRGFEWCLVIPAVVNGASLQVQHTDYPRYPHSTANSFVLFQRKVWTERVAQGKRWSRRELTAGVAAKYAALPKAEKV